MSFKVITLDELNKEEFQPNWVTPPGQTLIPDGIAHFLEHKLFEGEVPMTALMAMKLQSFFGVSTSFWYSSECIYQLRKKHNGE